MRQAFCLILMNAAATFALYAVLFLSLLQILALGGFVIIARKLNHS